MKTELIITTYNSIAPARCSASRCVACQSFRPDSICIADDGSGPDTAEAMPLIAFRPRIPT